MSIEKNMCSSTIAGILIGLGVIINSQTEPKIIGAMLFSFGLLTIINMKLNLYTGKIGFLYCGDIGYPLSFVLLVLFYNIVGIQVCTSLYAIANPHFIDIITTAGAIKFSKSIPTLLINSFFCGMLIHFAVKNKNTIITIFAVMIFILIGAEHCIADWPYLLFNASFINLLKFLIIVLGNSIGAIFIQRFS